jgi:hypothetical protein
MLVNIKTNRVTPYQFLILLAFFLTMAWGSKSKIESVESDLRVLSTDDIRVAVANIPTQYLIPPKLKSVLQDMGKDNDREVVLGLLRLSEIKGISLLNNTYPNVHFYKGLYTGAFSKVPFVYLMAVADNDCYFMLDEFNRLFLKRDVKISDRNIISLAKVFVILELASEPVTGLEMVPEKELVSFPQITFLEGKRIRNKINKIPYTVKLKVEINEQVEDWFFNVQYGQFVIISRGNPKEPIKKYGLSLYGGVKLGPWWRR